MFSVSNMMIPLRLCWEKPASPLHEGRFRALRRARSACEKHCESTVCLWKLANYAFETRDCCAAELYLIQRADQWRTHPARILGSTHVFQKGSVLATWNVKTLSSLPILTWKVQVETAFWESENFVMRGSIWIVTHQIFEGLGSWHGSIWKWRCPLLPTYLHGFET